MATKKVQLSTERRDEILKRLEDQRRAIERLCDDIDAQKRELKALRDEHKMRSAVVLGLLDEMNLPEQICTDCGVVRDFLETPWTKNNICPGCAHPPAEQH